MKPVLLEKLPNGLALFNIQHQQIIYPGQWLSGNKQQFPVFRYTDGQAQIVAPENTQFADQFIISGKPLFLPDDDKSLLLVADNGAITLLLFLINQLQNIWGNKKLKARTALILLGSKSVFPFKPVPSRFLVSGIPQGTIASAQLLEDLALPARLASGSETPGCFPGLLNQLLEQSNFQYLQKKQTRVVAIGTRQLLLSIKKLFAEDISEQFLVEFED